MVSLSWCDAREVGDCGRVRVGRLVVLGRLGECAKGGLVVSGQVRDKTG